MASKKKPPPAALSPIAQILHALVSSGWTGFEGFIATLLQAVCRQRLLLSASGLQSGLDARSSRHDPLHVAIECKRYDATTPLSERELVSEIDIASAANPQLDLWVLATTRPVSVQEDRAMHEACRRRGIDYLTLDSATPPNIGALDALCVDQARMALEFLATAGVQHDDQQRFRAAVATLDGRADIGDRVSQLRLQLDAKSVGFGSFRLRLNTQLLMDLGNPQRCLRRFHCALASNRSPPTVAAIPRSRLMARLQQSWVDAASSSQPRVVALLGDEGDGKSWVLADWIRSLLARPDAPAVFFVPAREPSASAQDVLARHGVHFGGLSSEDLARLRFARWFGIGTGRRSILVFDGINERLDVPLWSGLLHGVIDVYGEALHIVLTCRRHTWRTHYRSSIVAQVDEIDVGPFDDYEFELALRSLPAAQADAIRRLGPLVRKPRYFNCAVAHAAAFAEPHELTVPLLYYLDWRHRHSLRPALSPAVEDFEGSLMALAARLRDRSLPIAGADATFIASPNDSQDVIEELASGGVLRRSATGSWRVEPPFLALGCGLYLAGALQEHGGSVEAQVEAAWSILGDTSGWDLTADVMAHAFQHGLRESTGFSTETRVALLIVWSECLNALDSATGAIERLGPLRPELLVEFAEAIWNREGIDAVIETAVLHGFIAALHVASVPNSLQATLTRWAGAVHELAESIRSADDSDGHRAADVDRLCSASSVATLLGGAVQLRRVASRRLLRLGRLSLAAVSTADRRSCWRVLLTATVADQAMGGPRSSLIAWIFASSRQPLDDLLGPAVDALLADGDPVCLRAAHRLISWSGSRSLLPRLGTLPAEAALPKPPFQDEYDTDPCTCFFRAPSREQLPSCLERADVPLRFNISRANAVSADRDFALPAVFVERVAKAARALDIERLHQHMGQNDIDHSWSEIEALLCRGAPEVFAELMRRFARTARARDATALRQLSWSVADIADLLTDDEVTSLIEAWQRVASSPGNFSDSNFIEASLSESILLHRESAAAQWEWLLRRPVDSGELLSMADDFKTLSLEEQGRHLAVDHSDGRALRLALWFLSVQPALHTDTARRLVAAALSGADSGARALAFLILQRLPRADRPALPAIDLSARLDRVWAVERYYGTLALMSVEQPSADALSRCHLADVPAGLLTLQGEARDVWAKLFSAALLEALERRVGSAIESAPHPGIDLQMAGARRPWQRVSLTRPESNSVTHVAESSTWGGLRPGNLGDFVRSLDDATASHERRAESLDAALSAAASTGDWLFASCLPWQSIDALEAVDHRFLARLDDLVSQAQADGHLGRVQPVLEAATAWALRTGHANGLAWYDLLEDAALSVRHIDRRFGMLLRKVALLSAPRHLEIEARWMTLLQRATNDHELCSLLYVLVRHGHGGWVREQCLAQIRSGSPHGLALGIMMSASLDEDAIRQAAQEFDAPARSWQSELMQYAERYRRRGVDLKYWLLRAVEADDPVDRLAAMKLALAIEDHRAADILAEVRTDPTRPPEQRSRAWRIRLQAESSRRSPWAKDLDTHLFGRRCLEHAADPWLP
ncbi:MAG: hypothetical protein ACK5RK_05310 [Betaproteobacteria bacterium]